MASIKGHPLHAMLIPLPIGLEPPGFLGLHYGVRTPISVLVAHMIFGGILGAFYTMK